MLRRLSALLLLLLSASLLASGVASAATRQPVKRSTSCDTASAKTRAAKARAAAIKARSAKARVARVTAKSKASDCTKATSKTTSKTTSKAPKPAAKPVAAPTAPTSAPATPAPAASTTPAATVPTTTTTTTTTPTPTTTATTPAATTATATTPAPTVPTTTTPTTPTTTTSPGSFLLGTHAGAQWTAAWGDPTGDLQNVLNIGARGTRESFRWDYVEAVKGTYDWTRYDRLFTASARVGVTVLPVFERYPSWVTLTGGYPAPAQYSKFVADAVKRYGPGGTFWTAHPSLPATGAPKMWELWNEPYEDTFSNGKPDPAVFARMATAAVDAGRAANPSAKYLLAATYKRYGTKNWVDGMYAAVPDLNDHFDAVAVHPYGFDVNDPNGWYRQTMEGIRASFVAHGAADKPFWATEIGWATCTGSDPRCTTEANQAKLFADAVGRMRTIYSSYVRAAFLYNYEDGANSAGGDSEDNYGLMHNDGTPKPIVPLIKAFGATLAS